MKNPDCIFCKIVAGQLPCVRIYENDRSIAFLDIHPSALGHTLIVPKEHYDHILKTPIEVATSMIHALQAVAPSVMSAVGAHAFNTCVNTGTDSGQIIFHTHLHLLPRFKDDGKQMWEHRDASNDELRELQAKIEYFMKEKH
ncbi:MAG: hypothetical protein ACD_76C00015G0003 [uncultured bacterium]|nr:MAG: hypothetical protein ACD_76C00015G0003 [uncultured bacterium]HBD05058.1 HIT family protein [Candidatus Uhrbacteria bacterium]